MSWVSIYSNTFNPDLGSIYSIPVEGGGQIILHASNPQAQSTWKLACECIIRADFGGSAGLAQIEYFKLSLGKPRFVDVSSYPSGLDLQIDIPYWHQSVNLEIKRKPLVTIASQYAYQTLSVPANKSTQPALKIGYAYNSGHRGGRLVNHSSNTCWCMILAEDYPPPTRSEVVDFGLRVNGNGGQFDIPESTKGCVYLATSSTVSLEVRAMYYGS